MLNGTKNVGLLRRLFNLKNRLNLRNLNTTKPKQGGAAASHGSEASKSKGFFSLDLGFLKDHPKLHQGYLYRETGNLQGTTNANIGKLSNILIWWWIFYNVFTSPELIFGHMDYPNPAAWTNEELGIPPDDEE